MFFFRRLEGLINVAKDKNKFVDSLYRWFVCFWGALDSFWGWFFGEVFWIQKKSMGKVLNFNLIRSNFPHEVWEGLDF